MGELSYPAPLMLDLAMRLALANRMLVTEYKPRFEMYLHGGDWPFCGSAMQ